MGVRNHRAICPNCGGKIHTQPKGLGHFTWANSGILVKTGSECQHCGVALSGKVGVDNKAILIEDANKSWWERQTASDGANSPSRAEQMQTTIAELQADKGLALCQKDGKAVRPVNPKVVPVKRGKRLELRGTCPDCGGSVAWRLPEGTTQEEMSAVLAAPPERDSKPQPDAAPSSLQQLERLAKLKGDGLLTDKEFEVEKGKLLGG